MSLKEVGPFIKTHLKTTNVRLNEKMSLHTSFEIGGEADLFVSPGTVDEVVKIVKFACENQIPIKPLGNGTNLLVSDKGTRGIVLDCKAAANNPVFNGTRVKINAGYSLKTLAEEAAMRSLSGMENAVGIPGSIGGALIMNAGANDYNIGNFIENVTVVDLEGVIHIIDKKDLSFNYRHSSLKDSNYIILSSELALKNGNKETLFKIMEEELDNRKKKFPLNYPNAGSIFKRPSEGFPGKWIEMAGCKGMRVGDAEVSTKHANFIINKKNAKAKDVLTLIKKVQALVYKKFNVILEQEIIFWEN